MSALLAAIRKKALIAEDDVEALLRWAPYGSASVAERIFRAGLLSDAQLVDVFVSLGAVDGTRDVLAGMPAPAALGAISRTLAERHRALPLRIERARLVVAMLDPSDTNAIEKITFFCGLAVEPRAARARVLFQALADAYGIAAPQPDAGFLARKQGGESTGDDIEDALPAPSPELHGRTFTKLPAPIEIAASAGAAPPERPTAVADPSRSPLARAMSAASGDDKPHEVHESALSLPALRDIRPARTPPISLDDLARVRATLPLGTPIEARDSLPPQVLRLLVPPLRSAVLFLVRGGVAVGWDARSPSAQREQVRDLLLPLTAPSVLERASAWQRVAVGNPGDPTTTERLVFRALASTPPSSFAALPIVVGDKPVALLYIDCAEGMLDDSQVEAARQIGNTLADGLAPFVAAGTLFPPPKARHLPPITGA